ncbi:MAG: hypothetical protein R3Y54_01110 [Eubacteriales bacterium]
MNQNYEKLHKQFNRFIYSGYEYKINCEEEKIEVTYHFVIEELDEFRPSWEFPYCITIDDTIKEALEELIFSLGMVELISYWKLTCAPTVVVECGVLSEEQIQWWKKLYFHGLGEFYYINGITEVTKENFMNLECEVSSINKEHRECSQEVAGTPIVVLPTQSGYLVPIGGGKDSVVSLEFLHSLNVPVTTYSVNRIQAVREVIELDYEKKSDILARRTLDSKLITYNQQGFLNGHTPFSAIVAFSSVLTALLHNIEFIALSNESSANESTVRDSHVNHQYSKSVEFEHDFRKYLTWILDTKITYFSLLRPLAEVQIAKLFAAHKKYHGVFRSCNVGSKQGIWCGNCPKCLFVYMILLPFLTEEELITIFGENLLEKESMDQFFRELVGIHENKPFECVGTREEVICAIRYYSTHTKRRKERLLEKYEEYLEKQGNGLEKMLQDWYLDHNVTKELEVELRRVLNLEDC